MKGAGASPGPALQMLLAGEQPFRESGVSPTKKALGARVVYEFHQEFDKGFDLLVFLSGGDGVLDFINQNQADMMGKAQHLYLRGNGTGRCRTKGGELLGVAAADGLVYSHRDIQPQGFNGAIAGALHN